MQLFIKIITPIILIALGAGALIFMVKTKPQAEEIPPKEEITAVKLMSATLTSDNVSIEAMGTVIPARAIIIQPDVSGRIVYQNERLVPGGKFKTNDLIARIDKRDYMLALARERANVSQSDFQLKMEKGRKRVAEQEWQMIREERRPTGEAKSLTLREPHISNAQAASTAAKSGLKRAQLNVSRTLVRAPFNGMIREEAAEIGQLVTPQNRLATFVGTDEFWIQISVPVDKLEWLNIPGAKATVTQELSFGKNITREGRVLRMLGDLDPNGRMAQLVIAIKDPLALEDENNSKKPLLLGSYVKVELEGKQVDQVIQLPWSALRDGTNVWVMGRDNRLKVVPIKLIWRKEDAVYIEGLENNAQIVTSRISTPIAGMLLEAIEDKS